MRSDSWTGIFYTLATLFSRGIITLDEFVDIMSRFTCDVIKEEVKAELIKQGKLKGRRASYVVFDEDEGRL